MNEDKNRPEEERSRIEIDYDHIDVGSIMAQIKRNAVAVEPQPAASPEVQASPPQPVAPPPVLNAGGEPPKSKKSGVKGILLKIMKPFAPLIKLLILPVHQELRQTIETLDNTNRRLDLLSSDVAAEIPKIQVDLNIRTNAINERLQTLHEDVALIKEYIKLLHTLSHNLVVELTKLRIEHEALKSKVRIMEKDSELLGRRERALEKNVLK